ncbi:hypothetical protein LCGC14_0487000 [marine sediment metagenome]|uniref:VRR-NUC domain-containing protein n=1 Tax=marine sediment metagenome TaxID=412755 RepID=A0A0F9UUM0_9ZZZZ
MKSKKITKQRLGEGIVNMIHAKESGQKFKPGRKDGGIATKPIVPVDKTKSEAMVLKECLSWLRRRGVICDRMNVGAGQIGISGFRTYGIKGAGDIIGLTRHGIHFEIEVKRGKGGVLSLNQQKRKEKIMGSKGIYVVIHGVEELEGLVNIYF